MFQLQRQVSELETELDRRFEELTEAQHEVEAVTSLKDQAETEIVRLEGELEAARSRDDEQTEKDEELEELRSNLAEKEEQVERLEETLSLTQSRLTNLTAERDALIDVRATDLAAVSQEKEVETVALRNQITTLTAHIHTLEVQLRTHHSSLRLHLSHSKPPQAQRQRQQKTTGTGARASTCQFEPGAFEAGTRE